MFCLASCKILSKSRACLASDEIVSNLKRTRKIDRLTVGGEKGDCGTQSSCSTCSSNTVDIIFRVVGIVIVDHMSNVSHIFKYRLATQPMVFLRGVGDHVWSCEPEMHITLVKLGALSSWMINVHVLVCRRSSTVLRIRNPGFAA